jgi:hypothetical protein
VVKAAKENPELYGDLPERMNKEGVKPSRRVLSGPGANGTGQMGHGVPFGGAGVVSPRRLRHGQGGGGDARKKVCHPCLERPA